jgi:hypothetical protein
MRQRQASLEWRVCIVWSVLRIDRNGLSSDEAEYPEVWFRQLVLDRAVALARGGSGKWAD